MSHSISKSRTTLVYYALTLYFFISNRIDSLMKTEKSYNQRHKEELQSKTTKTISQYKPKPDVRRGF